MRKRGGGLEIYFFNWFFNLSTLVLSNGSEKVRNLIQMALKRQIFLITHENRPAAGDFAPIPLWLLAAEDTCELHLIHVSCTGLFSALLN